MEILADVVAGIAGIVFGGWAGWKLVKRYGRDRKRLWALNAGSFTVCVLLCALGSSLGAMWLIVGSLALLLGTLTGLKYGWHGGLPRGDTRNEPA